MKRHVIKLIMIILQFIFYYIINKLFKVPDRIMYNTFFIYLALNFSKNMYSFQTILIWEELRKQLLVHLEYLLVMLINDLIFWRVKYIPVHIIIGIIFTFFNILIIRIIRKKFRKSLAKSLIIVGVGDIAKKIKEKIDENNTFTMYNFLGYISIKDLKEEENIQIDEKKILGNFRNIENILKNNIINEIIIALDSIKNEELEQLVNKFDGKVEKIKIIPKLDKLYSLNSVIEDYDGMMVISTYNGMNKRRNKILKRGFDIIAGVVGCIVLGIVYLIFAPKIKKDGEKVIFSQNRVGKNLEPFKMYKFRTMYVDAEERLMELFKKDKKIEEEFYKNFKLKDDPRVTK